MINPQDVQVSLHNFAVYVQMKKDLKEEISADPVELAQDYLVKIYKPLLDAEGSWNVFKARPYDFY